MKNWIAALLMGVACSMPLSAAFANADGIPEIRIIGLENNAVVTLADNPQRTLDIAFVTDSFIVRPYGTCEGVLHCGHVHVQIDPEDTSCNYPGKPGNNTNAATGGDKITAIFALCPAPTGPHTLLLSLANDDHSPVLVNGKPVTAKVRVIAK